MAAIPLGKVTVASAGTPVQATSAQSVPSARVGCQSLQFQVAPANSGVVYIGDSTLNVSSGVGILAVLPKPTAATTGPFASATFTEVNAPAGLNAADFYIDSTSTNDVVFVSCTVQ